MLTGVAPGTAHVVVRALVGAKLRWAFTRVYARGRRDRRMIVLLNANAKLVRHAADQGVARLALPGAERRDPGGHA